jgi:hypothetical protein
VKDTLGAMALHVLYQVVQGCDQVKWLIFNLLARRNWFAHGGHALPMRF